MILDANVRDNSPITQLKSATKNNYQIVGIKIRNLKVDFKTEGTWRWVGQ